MEYRIDRKTNNNLSILGLGYMRFNKNKDDSEKIVLHAIKNGINYIDTAYIYGDSEKILGNIFNKHNIRDKIFLATKLPVYQVKKSADFDKFFNIQLERLQTDYLDYYLMHMLTDLDKWHKLCKMGIKEWIENKQKAGKIKQIGFSFHGSQSEFLKIIEDYNWDFTLIQYNYMNENYQAGKVGLQKAYQKGMTVMIMEPLLGGKLATSLPKKVIETFKKENPDLSPAAWALKWLWHQKEPTVVLSGMNTIEQLDENIKVAKSAKVNMLSEPEINTINKVVDIFSESYKIPCTGCNYCMPCPKDVNIPAAFLSYNSYYSIGKIEGIKQYAMSIGISSKKKVSIANCTQCGACETKCPQKIEIIKELKRSAKKIEPFWMKWILKLAKLHAKN